MSQWSWTSLTTCQLDFVHKTRTQSCTPRIHGASSSTSSLSFSKISQNWCRVFSWTTTNPLHKMLLRAQEKRENGYRKIHQVWDHWFSLLRRFLSLKLHFWNTFWLKIWQNFSKRDRHPISTTSLFTGAALPTRSCSTWFWFRNHKISKKSHMKVWEFLSKMEGETWERLSRVT